MRSQTFARIALVAVLALLTSVAMFGAVLPVRADSPTPSAAASSQAPTATSTALPAQSPAGSAEGTPAASAAPCPLPTPTPSPTPGASTSAAASPTANPDATATPAAAPTPAPAATPHALCPAQLSGNPGDVLATLFNPIFQTLFLGLATFYWIFGDIGIAIILLTLVIKTILIPLFRAQIVSQRRMQLIQPEIRALNTKYKGNRQKISEETMRLYRERGVNPASGCLPSILQLFLLIPIYTVITTGLSATNIDSALQIFGIPVLQPFPCQAVGPCIDPNIWWLGNLPANLPEILFRLPAAIPIIGGFGISLLALISASMQLIQTRMAQPRTNDPQQASQQRVFLLLPLISIVYGSFLPAGLFLYWIVFTLYSIIQQYLIVGWGSLFPVFGYTPGFAQNHVPRFAPPPPKPQTSSDKGGAGARPTEQDNRTATDRAAGTIKPARQRGRTSRRGRRR